MRMHRSSTIGRLLAILLVSSFVLTACGATGSGGTPSTASGTGNLRLAVREDVKNLSPYLGTGSTEQDVIGLIYDTLCGYDSQTAQLTPWLADSWTTSEDGKTLVFKLNPNAKWQDGKPVTAKDVEYTFTMVLKQGFPQTMATLANLAGAKATGDNEVTFSLKAKQPDTIRYISNQVAIVPEHIWKDVADPKSFTNVDNPVGSGAFKLKQRVEGQYVTLEATGNHYRMKPHVKTVTFSLVTDETVGVLSLQKGDLDALWWNVDPNLAQDVTKNASKYKNVKVAQAVGGGTTTLLFNLRKDPYRNPELRKAIAQAIDVPKIISTVLLGYGDQAGPGLVSPAAAAYYKKDLTPIKQNVDGAKSMLDAAGFKDTNGDGMREQPGGAAMKLELMVQNTRTAIDTGDLIAADLKKVGIDMTVKPVTPEALRTAQTSGEFNIALFNFSLTEPSMIFFYFHSSRGLINAGRVAGFNYGGFNDPTYDEVSTNFRSESDPAKRLALLQQMQDMLAAKLPMVPIYHTKILQLYSEAKLVGWVNQPESGINNMETFEQVGVKK